jgi:hypothetical protein
VLIKLRLLLGVIPTNFKPILINKILEISIHKKSEREVTMVLIKHRSRSIKELYI